MNKYEEIGNKLWELMEDYDKSPEEAFKIAEDLYGADNRYIVSYKNFVLVDGYEYDEAKGMTDPEFGYNQNTGEWAQNDKLWDAIYLAVADAIPSDTDEVLDVIFNTSWKVYKAVEDLQ